MESRVCIIMASHLSDVQIEMNINKKQADTRLNFVKWLINHYPNTDVFINPEIEFEKFKKYFNIK